MHKHTFISVRQLLYDSWKNKEEEGKKNLAGPLFRNHLCLRAQASPCGRMPNIPWSWLRTPQSILDPLFFLIFLLATVLPEHLIHTLVLGAYGYLPVLILA